MPNSNIFAWSELLYGIWTHWPKSDHFKYPIPTFQLAWNCCTISGHTVLSPIGFNTQFQQFSWLRIIAQCLDTLAVLYCAPTFQVDSMHFQSSFPSPTLSAWTPVGLRQTPGPSHSDNFAIQIS